MAQPKYNSNITDDFIGLYDNAMPEELIEHYEKVFAEFEETKGWFRPEDRHVKDDLSISMDRAMAEPFNTNFWGHWNQYVEKYSTLKDFGPPVIHGVKLQRTRPGEGYHVWHTEQGSLDTGSRYAVFIWYLNEIEQGGETEFLYLKKRIHAVRNRLIIWPAGYTHTHRGNPPLTEDKYIITGWVEFSR